MAVVYLPINAQSQPNIQETMGFLQPIKDRGIKTGLMLLLLGGRESLQGKAREIQESNVKQLLETNGPMPIIVMASTLPLSDLDFFHLPEKSVEHIKAVVDFVNELPGTKQNPTVSFHLNTLLKPEEYDRTENYEEIFDQKILPVLKRLGKYAEQKGVSLKIETVPVPEFGDLPDTELNTLINPYPVYSKYFEKIRSAGIGIALDLCHTFALLKKLKLPQTLEEELDQLQPGDVVHLNDSKDLFEPEKNRLHKEGVALGDGEIKNLPGIIQSIMDRDLHIVFEINDKSYTTGQRPNLKKSINYFLELI